MATLQAVSVDLTVTVDEHKSNDLGISKMAHVWQKIADYAYGTSANQSDLVYSDTLVVTSGGVTLDLNGSLLSILDGSAVSFADIVGFCIVNKETTSSQDIEVGAGSNPWTAWLKASGDAVVVGPGGVLVWTSPVDGGAVVGITGDILTLTATGLDCTVDIIVWGRSA